MGPAPAGTRPGPGALAITAAALALAIFETWLMPESTMLRAAAPALSGLDQPYGSVDRAIEWRVICPIAGLLPISTALINTGLAARVGNESRRSGRTARCYWG